MAKPYVMRARTAHGETSFFKDFSSLRKALKEASAYAKLYGRSTVSRAGAGPGRGMLADCSLDLKLRRQGGAKKYIAHCTVSREALKILKRKKRRR